MPIDIEKYLQSIKSAESGGDKYGKNPRSSASGLYQFTEDTWKDLGYNWKDRFNPNLQEEAVRKFTQKNANYLQTKGITNPTSTDLYGAHWFGPEGYIKLSSAPINTSVTNVFSQDVISANPNLLNTDGTPKTVGQVKNLIAQKVGGQGQDPEIRYVDYTQGLKELPGYSAGYKAAIEQNQEDPFANLEVKQREDEFVESVKQQQIAQPQEQQQAQEYNPTQALYSQENYQIQQFQPTQYQGQIFSEGFFQEGGIKNGNNPKRYNELIIDTSNKQVMDTLNKKFNTLHYKSNMSCTAGSLNCLTDFVQPILNSGSVRTLTQQNTSKYKIPSKPYSWIGNTYVPNNSIDAWEIHNQLSGEGLGTNLINPKSKLTYKKDKKGNNISQIPDQLDYKNLPVGTILGQGDSANVYTDPKYGTKSRHAMTIIGYDKKDGEPLVYDYGEIRRLSDNTGILKSAPINNVTIPKGYEKYTMGNLVKEYNNYSTKLGYDKHVPVNYNSKKEHILAIQNGVNEVKDKIGFDYNIPQNIINKMALMLPGLAYQETGINNNEKLTKSAIADNIVGNYVGKPGLKIIKNTANFIGNTFKEEGPRKKGYELEIEAYKKYPNDPAKRKAYQNQLINENSNLKNTNYEELESSVGPFSVKNIPAYSENKLKVKKSDMFGVDFSNKSELENGSKVALNILAENYARAKKQNPNLDPDELIDLSLASYNSGSKLKDKRYVQYFINKDTRTLNDTYLQKVKNFKFQDGGQKSRKRNPTEKEIKEWSDPGFRLNSVTDYFDPSTKKLTQSWFGDMARNEQPIQNNLQPAGLAQDSVNTNPITIQQPVRIPKYYDVVDTNNQTFGGGKTFYKSTDLSDLNELPTEGWNRKTIPHYGKGGFVVTRSHDRKGKTHKVTGPDGTVKYFGDSKLGQHPNDPERKAAFYARHKHNLENNPYFRAFARATWQDGGEWFGETIFEKEQPIIAAKDTQEYQDAMTGMMKSKIGMGNALGSPSIKRMSRAMPKTGMTPEGMGTHYMGSVDNYARPFLQDTGKDQLEYFENPRPSREDIRFNSPEEAQYFAERYKEVAPMSTTYSGLQEYQAGGIKYGTPEYKEAYDKGEIVTEQGVRSPIALDEVVIQNSYKRPRGFWEQYRDKIVDENKDAGLFGAIIGTPVSAITSLPQLAATYALTDKVQRPSEAMNIQNPYGAMAVDAIADPANLIGAGILTKEKALAKLAASKESGLLSNAYKLNPLALKEAKEAMLVRARPVGQDPYINMAESLRAKEAAGETLKWYQKNLLNPQTNPHMAAREKYFGQWFADNPSDLDFYINPETRNFADDAQIEILKARMPKSEAAKYNVKNFEDAKPLSNLHDTEYILPKDMVQQAERYSVDDLPKLMEEYNQINTPHWLKGFGKKNIETSIAPELRQGLNKQGFLDMFKAKPNFNLEIREIKDFNKQSQNLFKTPEGRKRLANSLGINPDDLDFPQVTFNTKEITGYIPTKNTINMNMEQIAGLKKRGFDLTPKTVFAHEKGHWLQREANRNSKNYQSVLDNYKKSVKLWEQGVITKKPDFPVSAIERTDFEKYAEQLYEIDPKTRTMDIPLLDELPGTLGDQNFINSNANYFARGVENSGIEPTAFFREMRQNMINKGYIKNEYDDISDDLIQKFMEENPKDRISSFTSPTEKNVEGLGHIFKNLPVVTPIVGASYLATQGKQKSTNKLQMGGTILDNEKSFLQEFQKGGPFIKKKLKLKDEREDAKAVYDNIQPISLREKRGNKLLIEETKNAEQDKKELQTTGKIKTPRSIHYNKFVPKKSELTAQTKSNTELEEQLGLLERPLVYLANPEKLLGDIGVPGMNTSELDRQAVMANRFNPNQSRLDRFVNNAKIGLGYVPEATVNTAMAAAFMPEGTGALGLVNEALNPLAGSKESGLLSHVGNYGRDVIEASKIAGRPKLPTYNNTYRWQADVVPESLVNAGKSLTPEQQALTGSWYTQDYKELPFYMRTRPGSGNINVARLSDAKISKIGSSMSDAAKGMSGKMESVATSNTSLPGELILPESLKNKVKQFRFDVNPSEYPLPSAQQELFNDPDFIGSNYQKMLQDEAAGKVTHSTLQNQYQPIMGIPRKYFPFQEGGTIPDNEKAFLQEYSNGGTIPVSSNGVYDYPGQEVIVPTNSGRITMKNVNYPILGIDEYGNQQMMQPNGEYQFPGEIIHETPKTKKKISINSKLK